MVKHAIYIILGCFFLWGPLQAQNRPVYQLKEVVVSDSRLEDFGEGHKEEKLNDSVIQTNGALLTSLLAFNSNIYFKEEGFGMVSSPSFRGTNASHTAVIWNGININSPLNGQVDFNTMIPFNYSDVTVRSGGGSVQYGTGAIGGSVHLNNTLRFQDHFENRLRLGYGSFDTRMLNFNQDFGKGKWSYNFGVNHVGSDNDYKYLDTDDRNENGAYEQSSVNVNVGHRLGEAHLLRLYHQSHFGDRNFSGTLVAPGRSRYEDTRHQTQFHYQLFHGRSNSQFRVAHLYERFKYFENKDTDAFTFGKVNTFLARYQLDTQLHERVKVNTFLQYTNLKGEGSSFGDPARNDFSTTMVVKHHLSKNLVYNINLRKDFNSDFDAPFVYGLDMRYAVSKAYVLKLNASRNFRLPTFNDLYWQPGGNLDLVAETSYQIDLGQELHLGNVKISLNGYYMETEDMIKWLPNNSGIWSPVNIDSVTIYGLEGGLGYTKDLTERQSLELNLHYGYTVSKNNETDRQLIYVPHHRGNGAVAYKNGSFKAFYQHLYTGEISIIGGKLAGYQVANAGLEFSPKQAKKWGYSMGITVNNVYNAYYESMVLRPMPNRNIQTRLTLNF